MSGAIVDFVVCARNNREIIASTLEGIARQTVRDFTCTLVDGRSTDGTPEFVRKQFPWVQVVIKDKDTGPADSRNIGISRGSAKFIVLADSDVVLDPRWTELQIALMDSDASIGIVCGKLVYAANPDILYAAYGLMNRYGVARDGEQGQPSARFTALRRCLWANTTALTLRREVVDRIGYFDSEMFLCHEDVDFGWRANLFGYRVLFNPAAVAVHKVHGTLTTQSMARRLIYLAAQNRLRTIVVNYELGNLLRYTSCYLVLAVLDGFVYAPRTEKLRALLWNLAHLAGTLRRRHWVQSHRSVKDKELWPLFASGLRSAGLHFSPPPADTSGAGRTKTPQVSLRDCNPALGSQDSLDAESGSSMPVSGAGPATGRGSD